jgi:hypothetical protein
MALLDDLVGKTMDQRICPEELELFDAISVAHMEDLEAYIPGITPVHHTPMVGVWLDGELVRSLQGYDARQFLLTL